MQKGDKRFLGMLGAGQQGTLDQPSFVGEVNRHGKISGKVPVGAADTLFLRAGAVHREAVDVHGNVAGGKRGQRNLGLHQKLDDCPRDHLEKLCGVVIHPLAQGRFRRNLRKTQSFTEKVIFPVLLDDHKIALPLSKQRAEGSDHIGMGTALAMDEARFVKRLSASPISEMPEVEV